MSDSLLDRLLARVPDAAFRALGGCAFAAYAVYQASRWPAYSNKVVYALETAVFVLLALAYLTRRPPAERARGAAEVLLPLVGAVLPFALLSTPPNSPHAEAVKWILAAGDALAVAGYVSLRRSFSILVEAREPVTSGLYRWIRHPVYAGQILAAAGVVAWRFSWANVGLFALFVAVQAARAALEERKLARAFPAYAEYARRTRRFVPFLY
ncbi:MAG TPA: isoprenylcysteine carboxylmethyltransferase family protein [Planctomycetota bacterium]|nr:isoprenylcysteine carboxylmethyltransferase family protein [Planctomycetota bacterium]